MKRAILAFIPLVALTGAATLAIANDRLPSFSDYPAKLYQGFETPLQIDSPLARKYAQALERADGAPINFAGRYVFVRLGAGKGCLTGAAIDVKTGHPSFLPFKICEWKSDRKPFEINSLSRLIIIDGHIDGKIGEGPYAYAFDGKSFKNIEIGVGGDRNAGQHLNQIQPAAGIADDSSVEAENAQKLKNDPTLGPLLKCYEYGFDKLVREQAVSAPDDAVYTLRILAFGGFKGIALQARDVCNAWYLSNDKIIPVAGMTKVEVTQAMGTAFMITAAEYDTSLKAKCLSHANDPAWSPLITRCQNIKVIQ